MRVRVNVPEGQYLTTLAWWPKGEVTGTVVRTFKNGKAAVAIDRLGNRSADNRKEMHLPMEWLTPLHCEASNV
jgi:hypothetical protein